MSSEIVALVWKDVAALVRESQQVLVSKCSSAEDLFLQREKLKSLLLLPSAGLCQCPVKLLSLARTMTSLTDAWMQRIGIPTVALDTELCRQPPAKDEHMCEDMASAKSKCVCDTSSALLRLDKTKPSMATLRSQMQAMEYSDDEADYLDPYEAGSFGDDEMSDDEKDDDRSDVRLAVPSLVRASCSEPEDGDPLADGMQFSIFSDFSDTDSESDSVIISPLSLKRTQRLTQVSSEEMGDGLVFLDNYDSADSSESTTDEAFLDSMDFSHISNIGDAIVALQIMQSRILELQQMVADSSVQ